MRSHLVRSISAVVAAFLVAGCGGSTTETPVATTVVVAPAGAVSLASINATRQLTAAVLDQHGKAMTGVCERS